MTEQTPGIAWIVQTHEHEPRSTDWYWTLGLAAIVGAILSVYFGNVLLACIVLIGALSLGFLVARGPREHMVRIDQRGITVDGTFYPYASILNFSVGMHGGRPVLALSLSNMLMPHTLLPLEEISPEVVRMTLRKFCEEREYEPRLVDLLAEMVGL